MGDVIKIHKGDSSIACLEKRERWVERVLRSRHLNPPTYVTFVNKLLPSFSSVGVFVFRPLFLGFFLFSLPIIWINKNPFHSREILRYPKKKRKKKELKQSGNCTVTLLFCVFIVCSGSFDLLLVPQVFVFYARNFR